MSISESNKSKTKMKYIEAFCTLLNLLFFREIRTNVGTTVRTNLILIIIQYVIENAFLSWIRVLAANLFLKLSLKLANSLLMDFFVPRSHCCGNLTVQVDFLSVMCVWEGPEREKELDPISIIEQVCFECWMESTQKNHPLHMWVADIYNNISIFECRDRERAQRRQSPAPTKRLEQILASVPLTS